MKGSGYWESWEVVVGCGYDYEQWFDWLPDVWLVSSNSCVSSCFFFCLCLVVQADRRKLRWGQILKKAMPRIPVEVTNFCVEFIA